MKEVVDLYAKLLIGTFSFIGPSFSLLIPIFYQAILRSTEKHRQVIENLKIISQESESQVDALTGHKRNTKKLQKLIDQNNREVRLLNPRRQVRRLFFSLFLAIVFVLFYYFQNSSFWALKYQEIRIITLGVSVLSFCCCVRVLWQIFCIIIGIKQEETRQPSLKLKPNPLSSE